MQSRIGHTKHRLETIDKYKKSHCAYNDKRWIEVVEMGVFSKQRVFPETSEVPFEMLSVECPPSMCMSGSKTELSLTYFPRSFFPAHDPQLPHQLSKNPETTF